MLVTIIFSFSNNVFKKLLSQSCYKFGLCGKELTLSQTSPGFYVSAVEVLKTLWEKEKLLVTSNFSFSHSVFIRFGEHSAIFIKFKIVVCKFFQFGRVQNLLFGKGLRHYTSLTSLQLKQVNLTMKGQYNEILWAMERKLVTSIFPLFPKLHNPLPHMPILGSSNSAVPVGSRGFFTV